MIAADSWTNLGGAATVHGEFVGLWNDRVYLRLDDGRRVSVRKDDLDADSRLLADRRAAESQQHKQTLRAHLQADSVAAAAAAPAAALATPSALTVTRPAYQPLSADADLQQTLITLREQLVAGHLRCLFDTLPASQQDAIRQLYAAGVAKLDATSWDQARVSVAALADQIVTKQNWLFSHPKLRLLSAEQQQQLLATAVTLRGLLGSDLLAISALQSQDWDATLVALDQALGPQLHVALSGPQSGLLMAAVFDVSDAAEQRKLVKINLPVVGTVSTLEFAPLEGRWAWGRNANAWQQATERQLKAWEPVADGSVAIPVDLVNQFQRLQQALVQLDRASNQEQFHAQLDQVLPIVGELVARVDLNQLMRSLPVGGSSGGSAYGSPGGDYGSPGGDYGMPESSYGSPGSPGSR